MSLDIILEADGQLSMAIVERSLRECGCASIFEDEGEFKAWFPSGMAVHCRNEPSRRPPSAEDTRDLSFLVAIRCFFRIKSSEPSELSSLEELDQVVRALASNSSAEFVVSFQYESLMYWRAANGLHKA